jgi:acylphosphatase
VSTPAIRRRVVVRGEVQGVFFRDRCRTEAGRHGVTGWVRNCSDGTVEAAFEGPAEAVEAVVAWCRRGPSRATVERVEVCEEPVEELSGFEVR